jgi:protein phosphatase 1L
MLLVLFQLAIFLFVMTKATLLLHQHLFKFKVKKSLKLTTNVPGVARRYGLVEVQGPWDMEDRAVVVPRILNNSQNSSFYGVFDGHHGFSASQYCIDKLPGLVSSYFSKLNTIEDSLVSAFKQLDSDYCSKEEHISGSTACVLIVKDNKITVANTGDSRAILVSEPEPKDVRSISLSIDHKPDRLDERERIAKAGGTVSHWGVWRVEGILAMSRVIGDKSLKKYAIPDPDTKTREIQRGDKFVVIGTDGVYDVLRNDEIASICCSVSHPEEAAMKIMQEIVGRGVVDNTTVLVVDVST